MAGMPEEPFPGRWGVEPRAGWNQPTAGGACMQVGDKIEEVSASFGPDVWEARNFGQVIYAIKTRNGQVYLKLLKRDGDLDILQARRRPLSLSPRPPAARGCCADTCGVAGFT